MKILFPIVELIDRYVIAKIKFYKTNGDNLQELEYYQTQVENLSLTSIIDDVIELQRIHEQIWFLESELKTGCENQLSLQEIGRRAIAIRNWNNKRVVIKNKIADQLGKDSVREIKREHLSE